LCCLFGFVCSCDDYGYADNGVASLLTMLWFVLFYLITGV